jgi:hypothetical protein
VNARILGLQAIIRDAEAEMARLRADCTHPSYTVGMWSWRIGSFSPARICDECKGSIPGITVAEDTQAWMAYRHETTQAYINHVPPLP